MKVGKNVYKPRYKIARISKSIVWLYKNSRLRRFINIRGRKILRRGYFKRYVLVLNNMTWAITRRYIKPYRKKRFPARQKARFSRKFYSKQQLRHFYGKVKENEFRNFFRNFTFSISKRNNSFFSALERRLDMVIFRMRYLPTIYACNQLVHHYGVNVNNVYETSPHALVNVGDIISLPESQWISIFYYIQIRLFWRVYGQWILKRRQSKIIKKKSWWLLRKLSKRKFRLKRWRVLKKKWKLVRYVTNIRKYFNEYFRTFDLFKSKKEILDDQKLQLQKKTFEQLYKKILCVLSKVKKKVKKLRRNKRRLFFWKWKKYFSFFIKIIGLIYSFIRIINELWLNVKKEEYFSYFWMYNEKRKLSLLTTKNLKKQNVKVKKLLTLRNTLLKKKYKYIQETLSSQFFYKIKKRAKLLTAFKKYKKVKGSKKKYERFYNNLIFFLIRHKYKKMRKKSVVRLKALHWYLPNYIFFDFFTLRGVFLYTPLPHEIFYSFRVSLKKVYSFYKGQGY